MKCHAASQKYCFCFWHSEKLCLVKITKYNFSACLKTCFETPHEMVQCGLKDKLFYIHIKERKNLSTRGIITSVTNL